MKLFETRHRRRTLLLAPLMIAVFAVWLEPTRVVWGWLRGEAFYQGRPTSWWREELEQWTYMQEAAMYGGRMRVGGKTWWREPNFLQRHFPNYFPRREAKLLLLDGDPQSRRVLEELLQYPDPETDSEPGFWLRGTPMFKVIVQEAMQKIEKKTKTGLMLTPCGCQGRPTSHCSTASESGMMTALWRHCHDRMAGLVVVGIGTVSPPAQADGGSKL